MIDFSITEGNYLVTYGTASKEEDLPKILPNQILIRGIKHIPITLDNKAGEKWNVVTNKWEDTRSAEEKKAYAVFEVQCARYAEYPPVAEFADAMYWQSKGDSSKMAAYFAKCDSVKQKHPKPKN
jgi:hypothetical protein